MEDTMSLDMTTDRRREDQVRHRLDRLGYALRKDRARSWSIDHQGGYRIVDPNRNWIVGGERFDLEIEDCEEWTAAEEDRLGGGLAS
jgi:hypothetical protein